MSNFYNVEILESEYEKPEWADANKEFFEKPLPDDVGALSMSGVVTRDIQVNAKSVLTDLAPSIVNPSIVTADDAVKQVAKYVLDKKLELPEKENCVETKLGVEVKKGLEGVIPPRRVIRRWSGVQNGECRNVSEGQLETEANRPTVGLSCIEREFFSFVTVPKDTVTQQEFAKQFEKEGLERADIKNECEKPEPDVRNMSLGDKTKIKQYAEEIRQKFVNYLASEKGKDPSFINRVALTTILHYPDSWMDHVYSCHADFMKKSIPTNSTARTGIKIDSMMFWPRSAKNDCVRYLAIPGNRLDAPRHVEVQHFVALVDSANVSQDEKTKIENFKYSELEELTRDFCRIHKEEHVYLEDLVPVSLRSGEIFTRDSNFASELAFRNTIQNLKNMKIKPTLASYTHGFDYYMGKSLLSTSAGNCDDSQREKTYCWMPQTLDNDKRYVSSPENCSDADCHATPFSISVENRNIQIGERTPHRDLKVKTPPMLFSDYWDEIRGNPGANKNNALREWLIQTNIIIDHKKIIEPYRSKLSRIYQAKYLSDDVYSYAEINKYLYLVNCPDSNRTKNTDYLKFKYEGPDSYNADLNLSAGIHKLFNSGGTFEITDGSSNNEDAQNMSQCQWMHLSGLGEPKTISDKLTEIFGAESPDYSCNEPANHIYFTPWGSPTCLAVMIGLLGGMEYEFVSLKPNSELGSVVSNVPKNSFSGGQSFQALFDPIRYKMNPPFIKALADRMTSQAAELGDFKEEDAKILVRKHIIPFMLNSSQKSNIKEKPGDISSDFREEELAGYDSTAFLQKLERIEMLTDKYTNLMAPQFAPLPQGTQNWDELAPNSLLLWPNKRMSEHMIFKLKVGDWEWESKDKKTHVQFSRGMWFFKDRMLVQEGTYREFMNAIVLMTKSGTGNTEFQENALLDCFYLLKIPNMLVPLYLERVVYETHKNSSFLAWHRICADNTVNPSDDHAGIAKRVKAWNTCTSELNDILSKNVLPVSLTEKTSLLVDGYLYAGGLYLK